MLFLISCMSITKIYAQEQADFGFEVRVLPDGIIQNTNSLTVNAGESFEVLIKVSADNGLSVNQITCSVLWDGSLLTLLSENAEGAALSPIINPAPEQSWVPLSDAGYDPVVTQPNESNFGTVLYALGDLEGNHPATGDFPFMKLTFIANADLESDNLTELIHVTDGAKASLITQAQANPNETDITGDRPELNVEIIGPVGTGELGISINDLFSGCSPISGVVNIYERETSELVGSTPISVEVNEQTGNANVVIGSFNTGNYDIYMKLDRYLRVVKENINITSEGSQLSFENLIIGDIDVTPDELIDIVDLQLILDVVGQPDLYSVERDLNCNAIIDIEDLQLILDNVGVSQGAVLPEIE